MSSSSLRRGTKRQYCLHLYTPRLVDIVNKIPTSLAVSATALFAATAAKRCADRFDGYVRRTNTSRTFAWYAAKTAVAYVNAGSDALSSTTPAVTTLLASATSSGAAMKNAAELAFALQGQRGYRHRSLLRNTIKTKSRWRADAGGTFKGDGIVRTSRFPGRGSANALVRLDG
jgi:hypothetical protein